MDSTKVHQPSIPSTELTSQPTGNLGSKNAELPIGTHTVTQLPEAETQAQQDKVNNQKQSLRQTEEKEPHTPPTPLSERQTEVQTEKQQPHITPSALEKGKEELANLNEYLAFDNKVRDETVGSGVLSEENKKKLYELGEKAGVNKREIGGSIMKHQELATRAKEHREMEPQKALQKYNNLKKEMLEHAGKHGIVDGGNKSELERLTEKAKGMGLSDETLKRDLNDINTLANRRAEDIKNNPPQQPVSKPSTNQQETISKPPPPLPPKNNPFFKAENQKGPDSLPQSAPTANPFLKAGKRQQFDEKLGAFVARPDDPNSLKAELKKFGGILKTLSRSAYNKLPKSIQTELSNFKSIGVLRGMVAKGQISKETAYATVRDFASFKMNMAKEGLKGLSSQAYESLSKAVGNKVARL